MNFVLQPWQLLLVILAGWINRQPQEVLEYLRTENQILKESYGKKRIPLTDNQRRRLAVKGKILGRKVLGEIGTIVTPDTILRWHRQLVAQKWDYSHHRQRVGRPRVSQTIVELLLRLARENPTWGYDRIEGALANLGHKISDTTVGNVLKEHGIEPAPERRQKTTWKAFLKAHWDVIGATDFTTIEVWTKGGLVTIYLLFVMELGTRRVHFAGSTANPNEPWMKQVARNLTDSIDGFLLGTRYLIMDRDSKFCESFLSILERADVDPVKLPARSPNLNAYMERFMRSLKSECLNRMIFFGEKSARRAVNEFLEHYHVERNHQARSRVANDSAGCCIIIIETQRRSDLAASLARQVVLGSFFTSTTRHCPASSCSFHQSSAKNGLRFSSQLQITQGMIFVRLYFPHASSRTLVHDHVPMSSVGIVCPTSLHQR